MSHPLPFSKPADLRDCDEPALHTTTSCGRTVVVLKNESGERVEVQAPDGAVEIAIVFTESGPVLKMQTGRLEVDTKEDMSIKCRQFEVNAEEGVRFNGKEFRAKTEDDIILNGAHIRLNCDEETTPQ